ncbi:MAG TPA: HU family DNA-binding protein [Thermomicrobiales bacterium]|jgi:DNA-binding protein HU-beta|nr:HU family DNA-binding protein [Thermomicrobiales bacterium]
MHKNELIRQVALQTDVPHRTVARVVNEMLRTITDEVGHGRRVVLTGFGTFELRERSARRGVDPRTGTDITVPATRTPGFTSSATFKQRVQPAPAED